MGHINDYHQVNIMSTHNLNTLAASRVYCHSKDHSQWSQPDASDDSHDNNIQLLQHSKHRITVHISDHWAINVHQLHTEVIFSNLL